MSAAAAPLDRLKLLQRAARVIEARMPTTQGAFRFADLGHARRCRARFDWPGVLSVSDDNTGELLARSIAGQPTAPDAWTQEQDRRERGEP